MSGQRTPGPWRTEYDEETSATMVYGPDGIRLAELLSVLHGDDLLIAAAPDLLEALSECEDLFATLGGCEGPCQHTNPECEGRQLARAAIAKATGEAPR